MNATSRRGFLGSILAACAAPAIIKAEILMPVRTIVAPDPIWVGVDLVHTLFKGEVGQYNGVRIITLESAAMAQAGRFFSRTWGEALHQAATGKPLLVLHPEDDLLRALKGPGR